MDENTTVLLRAMRICFFIELILVSLPLSFALSPYNSQAVVDLGYAKYQGSYNTTSNVTSMLGMRYARAPLGALYLVLFL